jgi:hypothetical protein
MTPPTITGDGRLGLVSSIAVVSTVIRTPALTYYIARGGILPMGAAAAPSDTPTGF